MRARPPLLARLSLLWLALLCLALPAPGRAQGVSENATPDSAAPSAPTLLPANARSGVLGAWVRPDARGALGVLSALRRAGYTDIFLETFYHGMTIYPGGVAPQLPEFAGRDVLSEYARAAATLGLRLHAWLEVLYWQPPSRYGAGGGLLSLHPEWETRDAAGRPSSQGAHGMGFADPGLFAVRQTVYTLAGEVARRAPAVGLHLDYLRLPAGGDYGYQGDSVRNFERLSGHAPWSLDPAWLAYRQDLLTQVAGGLSRAYRAGGGQGLVTAAVNPEYPFYKAETLQLWPRWSGVDVFIPMAYSQNNLYLQLLGRYVRARSPKPVWMGLSVGDGYPSLQSQVGALKPEGYSNFVVFGLK